MVAAQAKSLTRLKEFNYINRAWEKKALEKQYNVVESEKILNVIFWYNICKKSKRLQADFLAGFIKDLNVWSVTMHKKHQNIASVKGQLPLQRLS